MLRTRKRLYSHISGLINAVRLEKMLQLFVVK
jgi:hypothetical protein